jgi:hypothetical protein
MLASEHSFLTSRNVVLVMGCEVCPLGAVLMIPMTARMVKDVQERTGEEQHEW